MKALPTGIQNIEEILSGNYIYVDKTALAHKLITSGKHYFLSRPRRFGKSLFVSTLEEIFKGNKELFKNCAIHNRDYNWQKFPILHFDFSLIANQNPEQLRAGIQDTLEDIAKKYNLVVSGSSPQSQLKRLIESLAEKHGRVVILVDEYDQPIISQLDKLEIAEQNRKLLQGFYGALKGLDARIQFTFITGVSKFSQVSIFSGLNNLIDITLDESYTAMLGYTEDELSHYFADYIRKIAAERNLTEALIVDELRLWYNGYRFSRSTLSVYNPFSTLNYMRYGIPKSYWYRTGTPTFLIKQMQKFPRNLAPLGGTTASESALLNISRIGHINLTALMFQTGYLTITDSMGHDQYRLGFPNKEVGQAFFESLVECFAETDPATATDYLDALENQRLHDFFEKIKALFASFPYHLFAQANEATYQGILLAIIKGMGLTAGAEHPTNLGRIDLTLETQKIIYIIECKLDKTAQEAMRQIEERKYYQQYTQAGKDIGVIGVNFSSKDRNIDEWKGKLLDSSGKILNEL